jgi:hypothetical protein
MWTLDRRQFYAVEIGLFPFLGAPRYMVIAGER